jgi:ABC-2 type transport system ATP-binding protein
MVSGPIIIVKNLYHKYGNFTAVNGISFEVEDGEIFSFLGPNGAGKSTAINILITLLAIQKGTAMVAGYDVARESQKIRESIGVVFQEVTLDRDMTCREILEFHGRLYRMLPEERKKRTDELLALVQLENKRDVRTKYLSGGMKRRLEIARGLMTRPRVLFLDEPTIGLDPQTRTRMWDYIRSVNEEGTTIFLTTHYMDEADNLSDRISIIDYGRIVTTGRSYELKNILGEDLVYMETNDTAGTKAALREMEEVKEIQEKSKGIVTMLSGDGTKLLPKIMENLNSRGIRISVVNLKKPSMDDVFLHFTGRELRDKGSEKLSPEASKTGS